jgi:uncharacterized protein (TIGR03435 family)
MAMIGRMRGGPGSFDPGQITWLSMSFQRLIEIAFERQTFEIAAPAWMQNTKYDIVAKLPPGTKQPQMRQMLEALLVERLGLKTHHETRDVPVYELTVLKGVPKMKPAESAPEGADDPVTPPAKEGDTPRMKMDRDSNGRPQLPPGFPRVASLGIGAGAFRISARVQTMADIARLFRNPLRLPVLDKTGLTGQYDFNLDYAPEGTPPPPPDAIGTASEPFPDFIHAVALQLGLKLEKKTAPQDILVVDSAEKEPVKN